MSKEINLLSFRREGKRVAGGGSGKKSTEIGLRDMCEVMPGTISRMIKDDIARLCTRVTASTVGPFNVFSKTLEMFQSRRACSLFRHLKDVVIRLILRGF